MKIAVSQAAADDLARLHDFLADKNAVAAGRAIAALISGWELIPQLHGSTKRLETKLPFHSFMVLNYHSPSNC